MRPVRAPIVDAAEQAVAAATGIHHDAVGAVPYPGRVQVRVQPGLEGQVDDLAGGPGGRPAAEHCVGSASNGLDGTPAGQTPWL